MLDSFDLTQEIDIDASPELVFRFFTDAELRDRHADGWEHYLPRLAAAASGADPGPDAWRTDGTGDPVK